MGYIGGSPTTIFSRIYKSDNLPPMTVTKKVKESRQWKEAVLDSFEYEAIEQFKDNLQFIDLYRMVDGKLSYQELSEVAPHMKDIQSLLDGVGVPSFLRHYDIIGIVVNALVGYYNSFQPKFHVTDTGETAENEFVRHKNEELQTLLKDVIQNRVNLHLAKNGFSQEGKQFETPEEQQQYIQQLNAAIEEYTPKDTQRTSKKSFKTIGMKWGEATMDRDRERFNFSKLERNELKDQLTSGRCFRHFRIGYDEYEPESWSAKNTFFSREVEAEEVHKGEYAGRLNFWTPAEVIRRYGHEIDASKQKELLGGNESWKSFVGDGYYTGSIEDSISSNFNKQVRVPFANYHDYNFYLGLQEETGVPMGVQTIFNDDGSTSERDRFLPRLMGDYHGRYSYYARIMRDDYKQRLDLCQVTEVYFRAYELWGYLTYEDSSGAIVTEEVTEDILPGFLKDNGIKKTYKESLVKIVKEFKPNTLQWTYRPVIYEGAKIQSENLTKPIYLYCRPCEHQIKGDSEFDRWLPVAGWIGESVAKRIEPYQAKYNLCMNQIYSLLEKEIGIFFLLDTAMIPSEFEGWGDAQEALIAIRNIAKDTGILPVSTSGDMQRNNSNFNQFSTYNLSYSSQISDRIRLAEFVKSKAYEVIGINPNVLQAPSKYETAEGVKQSQEATFAQISEIYENFNQYIKAANELHLSVAQYCQSNNKDLTIHYTKSDGSIQYLKFNDPEFPFRRIGLIVAHDSKKRKELEQFRSYVLGNNTLGTDTLEIAKLIASDEMSEAIEISRIAQEKRDAQEREKFQRDQTLVQQKGEQERAAAEEGWAREEKSRQLDRENNLDRERIKALGRAADKQSDVEGFEQINKEADRALKENDLNFKQETAKENYRLQDKKQTDDTKHKMEKLKLDTQKLKEKIKDRESKEYIAEINKN
jgi:hypothetical protein